MSYYIYDQKGNIVRSGSANPEDMQSVVSIGQTLGSGEAYPCSNYVKDGVLLSYTPEQKSVKQHRPFTRSEWDNTTMSWLDSRTLEEVLIEVRYKRDQLIAATDWRIAKAIETGVPMSTAWTAYRQALRDITTQKDLSSIVWPTEPT